MLQPADPRSRIGRSECRALYLFPTKALAQDQLKGLLELVADDAEWAAAIRPGVYDGDTPTAQRRRHRPDDIPGHRIPSVYAEYVRTGFDRDMNTVLYHNAVDLITLLDLSLRLAG